MLSYLKIQNFKSILDLKLDMSYAEGKAPNKYQQSEILPFLEVDKKNRFVPVLALYGANGAGKTTSLEAFMCLQTLLRGNRRLKSRKPFYPNKINAKYDATSFEISVFVKDINYIYCIVYNKSEILRESFYRINQETQKKNLFEIIDGECNFEGIVTDTYDDSKLKEIFNVECKDKNHQWLPFASCLEHNYSQLNLDVTNFCRYMVDDLIDYNCKYKIQLPEAVEILANDDSEQSIQTAFSEITTELKRFDLDIDHITMSRQQQDFNDGFPSFSGKPSFVRSSDEGLFIFDTVSTYHKDVNNEEVQFDFEDESEGTKTLSGLLGVCLFALKNGKTVLVDELERSLHPILLKEIIGMFKDKKQNKTNAQLIFTAHNTDILDDKLMRVSEVAVIDKTKETGSTILRISETNARNVSNFRKRYLKGNYKGLPKIHSLLDNK